MNVVSNSLRRLSKAQAPGMSYNQTRLALMLRIAQEELAKSTKKQEQAEFYECASEVAAFVSNLYKSQALTE